MAPPLHSLTDQFIRARSAPTASEMDHLAIRTCNAWILHADMYDVMPAPSLAARLKAADEADMPTIIRQIAKRLLAESPIALHPPLDPRILAVFRMPENDIELPHTAYSERLIHALAVAESEVDRSALRMALVWTMHVDAYDIRPDFTLWRGFLAADIPERAALMARKITAQLASSFRYPPAITGYATAGSVMEEAQGERDFEPAYDISRGPEGPR